MAMKTLKILFLLSMTFSNAWAAPDPELVNRSQILKDVFKNQFKELNLKMLSSKGTNPFEYKMEGAYFVTREWDGYCQKALVLFVSNKPNVPGHKDYRLFGQEAFFIPANHFFPQNQYIAEFLSNFHERDYFVFAQYGNVFTKERECKLNANYDNLIVFTGRTKGEDPFFQETYYYEP
jgi:hypothetical protein